MAIDDILHVFPDNAITALLAPEFEGKYDFIWISQVLHFLTPLEVQQLNVIFQKVLKPGGKVYIEANTIDIFRIWEDYQIVEVAYKNAKEERVPCPGLLTVNAASMFSSNTKELVRVMITSAYNQNDMAKYAIPQEINSYVTNTIGPAPEKDGPAFTSMKACVRNYPGQFYINEYCQTMNFFEPDTAKLYFSQTGFTCLSYLYNPLTGEEVLPGHNEVCLLVVNLQKSPALQPEIMASDTEVPVTASGLIEHGLFNEAPHDGLLRELQPKCSGLTPENQASFFAAIDNKDYSLALRRASIAANLDLIKTILKYKQHLAIDVNAPSSNKKTALDWISCNKHVDAITKERCISLLTRHGGQSGCEITSGEVNSIAV